MIAKDLNDLRQLLTLFSAEPHAKKTLHQRKFPKREQKIIVAYKGNLKNIKERFANIGRL